MLMENVNVSPKNLYLTDDSSSPDSMNMEDSITLIKATLLVLKSSVTEEL